MSDDLNADELADLIAQANGLRRRRRGAEQRASDADARESAERYLEEQFAASRHLASYGSLAPGQANHHVVESLGGSWEEGWVEGELLERGWGAPHGYPGMRWVRGGGRIGVALLRSDRLPGAWAAIDEFEGPDYCRILVPVFGAAGLIAVANIYEVGR